MGRTFVAHRAASKPCLPLRRPVETESEREEFARRYAAERAHSAGDTQNRAKLDAVAPSDQHAETA